MTAPSARLWGGRFAAEPAAALDRLNRSLPVDRRLWSQDIRGSRAWARALTAAGVIDTDDRDALLAGLDRVAARLGSWSESDWAAAPDEDIHSLVERLLREDIGDGAGRLHTGRSRNDQVATGARLWALDAAHDLNEAILELERTLADRAAEFADTLMPAHTHLQPAQPVTAGHWLLSHAWPLERDRARLADARARCSVLPLGSGAVAGCPFPVDREALAAELGFERISPNSMDAVADRDWAAELLFVIGLTGVHLSRLAEDVIIFASEPFGLLGLADDFATGSSLMPQKKNPDVMELVRGKAGTLIGDLTGLLAVLKGTPSGYNKDYQDDKAILFRAVDTLLTVLSAVTGTLATFEIRADRCAAAIPAALMATDLADLLVGQGVPFRAAHEEVGRLVRESETSGRTLAEVVVDRWRSARPSLDAVAITAALDPAASARRRDSVGGTAPARVREQIAQLRARLGGPSPD